MNRLLAQLEKKPTYSVGLVNGTVGVVSDEELSSDEEEDNRDVVNYEQNFVEAELKRYAETSSVQKDFRDDVSSYGCLSEVDGLDFQDQRNNPIDIYRNYNFKLNTDIKKELPIDFYKEKILKNIEIYQVVVIEGPTGCGKTTQVPQLILDNLREKGQPCNIVVTQPRKIATINVARRVCEERGWALGTVCGYQVGLEKKISPDMILTYMTIGVLLQKIIRSKHLNQFTHIVIDEVHERNQELDFLLLLVRKFLFTNSPHTKVILMSATFKANVFARYFRTHFEETIDAPVIRIEKEGQYSKTIFYLEHVMGYDQQTPKLDITRPEIPKVIWERFSFLVNVFDKIENDAAAKGEPKRVGSVLVFLPGINEIEEADKLLKNMKREGRRGLSELEIIPLHSSLPNDEQAKAFKPPRPGCRKIILSTNIAESSVTVPDSFYVIDFCLTKVMTVDPVTKYSSLKLEWASHVNCEQRAGRVGRTCDGRVYRLVSKDFYMEEMAKESTPEILRAPLDRVVLQAKMLELNDTPAQILALALDPPNLRSIDTTLWHLKEAGALLKTCRGVLSNADGDVTFLGQVMASLPLDVHLAKLIVLGQLFSCLEETIIIAAGCSIQNVFSIRYQQRLDAYKKILLWSDYSESDLITLLNLYNVWQRRKRDNAFDNHSENQWCRLNMVNLKSLKEWNLLVAEIRARLERVQIKETVGRDKVRLEMGEKAMTLKIVIAGAFYPNYFLKTSAPELGHEREAVRTVGGRNPLTTVYFTGMDPQQPIQVYVRPLKRMLTDSGEGEQDIKIGDMDGSSKIFVECKHTATTVSVLMDGHQRLTELPGRIPKKVYELIRKRQLNYEFNLKVLPYQKAWAFAEKHGVKRVDTNAPITYKDKNCYSSVNYTPIPSLERLYIEIQITQHIDAGHFWAQNSDPETNMCLSQIEDVLNKQVLHSVVDLHEELKMGKYYAAKYALDDKFYRCKITALSGRTNQIIFIDYGNIQEVSADEIYVLPNKPECHLAPLAFECEMCSIKPAVRENPSLVWTKRVNDVFKNWTEGIILYGEVFSVVSDVVHLELFRQERGSVSLNQLLIQKGFAEPCEEGYLSKQDHQRRLAVQQSESPASEAVRMSIDKFINYDDFAVPDSSQIEDNCKIIQLKGPFNPLEVKLYSCIDSSNSKGVVIDGSSVNCVLLDYEPESQHSRLVVGGYVGQSADGNRMRLRQTSVMPSIPGFPMLMSLLFCPTMEPKVHRDLSKICAVLCGLGVNENTGKPFYPSHDMLLSLDTELTAHEIEKINRLRYLMNNGIRLMQQVARRMSSQDELLMTQKNIKKVLMELINMRRTIIPRTQVVIHGSPWGKELYSCQKLKPNTENDMEDIWPLLWFVRLGNASADNLETSNNLQMMMDMVFNVRPFENISCSLCGDFCHSLYNLRLHLLTENHKSLESRYHRSLEGISSSESGSDEDDE